MSDPIVISKTLSIRDCGFDEYWLQDQVFTNPSILGLGELDVVSKEKQQSSGGKLDLLLKNPEDDSMYEVEIMLGGTDESHIIRTIEYWDLERKRWPKRQHFAVLVAESITRRFFNVIQLLSLSIPVIAIQANAIEADGKKILHFTKILDIYEEPEEENRVSSEVFGEQWWRTNALWNVTNTEAFQKLVQPVLEKLELGFTKNYVSLVCDGYIYFTFRKRSGGKSHLTFWLSNANVPVASSALDEKEIPYDLKPYDSEGQHLRLTVDQKLIQANSELFLKIA
ncbi:MAG TPA: hypothetical protein VIK62_08930, partial [Verrucomicrobiae bacterium]